MEKVNTEINGVKNNEPKFPVELSVKSENTISQDQDQRNTFSGNCGGNVNYFTISHRRCRPCKRSFPDILQKIRARLEKIKVSYRLEVVDLHINSLFNLVRMAKVLTHSRQEMFKLRKIFSSFFRTAWYSNVDRKYLETVLHIRKVYANMSPKSLWWAVPVSHATL
ncbi:MAG: hypothetical protein LBI81_03805 [Puniceicoccales bacterium]|jgi:hypothetical protein|nr:hypothetical protein [Puniceicoccales bacterium]